MRIRPFFWVLLVTVCLSVFIFAANVHLHAPVQLQVHVDAQPPTATGITTLNIHLSDPQGLPIDEAQVVSGAHMTNMNMATSTDCCVSLIGQGDYKMQLHLSMAGQWSITLQAHADGFLPSQKTLLVQVV